MTERTIGRLFGAGLLAVMLPVLVRDLRANDGERPAARTVWDSVYSAAQAGRGETAYAKACARCHKPALVGGDESPALTGSAFLANWNGLFVADLQDRIRKTMPSDSVGIYDRALVTDVIAYVFKMNGFPAGGTDLPKETEPLRDIVIQAAKP